MPLLSADTAKDGDDRSELAENASIAQACAAAQRPVQSVTLLVVGKTFAADTVRAAFDAGERCFGENYVQEGIDKMASLSDLRAQIEWHLIGPLQSNKTRVVAESFDWVHSVDRLKIAQRLRTKTGSPAAATCLQVNISGEPPRAGCRSMRCSTWRARWPSVLWSAARATAIPEPVADRRQRAPHRRLRSVDGSSDGLDLDTLSWA
jgi:hypothetical protein